MGDAGRQEADRLELLGLVELQLDATRLGAVSEDGTGPHHPDEPLHGKPLYLDRACAIGLHPGQHRLQGSAGRGRAMFVEGPLADHVGLRKQESEDGLKAEVAHAEGIGGWIAEGDADGVRVPARSIGLLEQPRLPVVGDPVPAIGPTTVPPHQACIFLSSRWLGVQSES